MTRSRKKAEAEARQSQQQREATVHGEEAIWYPDASANKWDRQMSSIDGRLYSHRWSETDVLRKGQTMDAFYTTLQSSGANLGSSNFFDLATRASERSVERRSTYYGGQKDIHHGPTKMAKELRQKLREYEQGARSAYASSFFT